MNLLKCVSTVVAVGLFGLAVSAADVDYGMFPNVPEKIESASIIGARFGLPCSVSRGYVEGAELSLCYSATRSVEGFKFTLIGVNGGDELEGGELAFVNWLNKELEGLQLGFFNHSARGGFQIGFINNCSNNATFQLGLLNINKKGWLPAMIFVNFGSNVFDD